MNLETAPINRESLFLMYCQFGADVERTGHAAGLSPVVVLRIADEENWLAKLKPILELRKSQRPGDVERGLNRGMNFVMAHRYRLFLERVMNKLTAMDDTTLDRYLFESEVVGGKGEPAKTVAKLTTRPLADLAGAIEKMQALSYMATQDTATERVKRAETASANDPSASDMHSRIAQAMQSVGASNSPRALLVDAQLAVAQEAQATGEINLAKRAEPLERYEEDSGK